MKNILALTIALVSFTAFAQGTPIGPNTGKPPQGGPTTAPGKQGPATPPATPAPTPAPAPANGAAPAAAKGNAITPPGSGPAQLCNATLVGKPCVKMGGGTGTCTQMTPMVIQCK